MSLQGSITTQEPVKPATGIVVRNISFSFQPEEFYATAMILFVDEDGKTVSVSTLGLTEQELSGWGSDDAELVEIIKTKLGL